MAGKGYLALIAVGLVGLAQVTQQTRPTPAPPAETRARLAETPARTMTAIGNGIGGVTLERAPNGHFYAEARVNGAPVRFLVDTGATGLVLTREDARRAGIGAGDYSERAIGAGGDVRLMPVVLGQVTMGPIVANQVEAHVAEENSLPVSLMGQSYLSRIGSVSIQNDRMVLR